MPAGSKPILPPPLESTGQKYTLEQDKTESDTFLSKVHELKLPTAPYQKKGKTTGSSGGSNASGKAAKAMMRQLKESAKKQPELKFYLLEDIDLSGYEQKGFNKMGLQELLKGLENLVSIRKVVLKQNGIIDECSAEISELFKNPKIQFLDLSANKMGKTSAQAISAALTETSHLIWLEYFGGIS